jgi:hypothetical protein
MQLDICDICQEVIKHIKFDITIRARIKSDKGDKNYKQNYINNKIKGIKLLGDYEICEGCKKVLDHLFKLRIKEVKKIKKKVARLLKTRKIKVSKK